MIPSLWRDKEGAAMFSKAYSAAICGMDALIVSVEADVSDGLPVFDLVGLVVKIDKYYMIFNILG